ncbi:glucose 1-dehydrogenase [Aureobasidium sp. EXF-10727]|nr:glucose 1-dehydrogenase [Aureobasidium sp. EXF-10727]
MGKKRVLVGYGVTSLLSLKIVRYLTSDQRINTQDGSAQNSTNVSRGIFGATVGLDRLLKLFDKHDIKATFLSVLMGFCPEEENNHGLTFGSSTPAHTIESFPKQMTKVKDAGHEIGLHGYTHEHISKLSLPQQKDVLQKSIEVLTNFTGKKPQGYTAPAWDTSKQLIPLLEEHGIVYDHSFMHHDLQPYLAPDSSHEWIETDTKQQAETWMEPMTKIRASSIVEIPANWHVDDWPPLQPMPGRAGTNGFVSTHEVERLWLEQFDFAYEEYDSFIFPMSIHPQVSGKPQVIKMHERIIAYINKHEGVEWMPFNCMAKEFLEGRIQGVEIEGGAEV